jgi:2-methylcitrate dehydratase PrpD
MIEALLDNEELAGVGLEEIASFELTTNPRWLTVCDIKQPRTGLEVKFSYNWLAAMTLRGDKTGDDRIYTDAIASDPAISTFARRVSVTGDDGLTDLEVRAVLRMVDGSKVEIYHDLAAWVEPNVLAKKLRSKAEAVIGERGAQLWDQFARLDLTKADEIGKALSR